MDHLPHHILNVPELVDEAKLTPDEKALLRCQLAKKFEYSGEYEAASELLRPFWPGVGHPPDVVQLEDVAAAEVLLRAGVLTGWLGSKAKSAGSQETAKDFISRSISLFQQAGSSDKVNEAHVELAYCYFREGALDEARVLLQEALKRLDDNVEVLTLALLRSATVEAAATRFNDSLKILTDAAPLFEKSENHSVRGSYHNQLAYTFQSLGTAHNRGDFFDRAIVEFTAACYHFEQSGHTRYQAHVENNLGLLLRELNKFEESHEHLDRARTLFMKLGDNVYAAMVDETRAQVLIEQGRLLEAAEVAGLASQVFGRVNASNLLAEALTTRGKALARLGRSSEARQVWERAAALAELAGSLEVAGLAVLTLCEESGHLLGPGELREAYNRADHLLAASQSPTALARLRQVARRALTTFSTAEDSEEPADEPITAERGGRGGEPSGAEKLIAEMLRDCEKQVLFTPEAIETMNRLFLADGMFSLSELIERSIADAQPGTVVSADDVEIVAMRSRKPRGNFTQPWADFSLKEEIGCPERRFIELALKASGGKISAAARLLGLKHNERLTSIIKSRYPELLAARTPPVSRRRSIIRKPKR
jgi:tetratricopeptide (TPR) repeat protein